MKKEQLIRGINRAFFQCRKYSPEIMIFSGIVLSGISVVTACVATTHLKDITEPAKKALEKIDASEIEGCVQGEAYSTEMVEYTPEDAKIDRRKVYMKTNFQIFMLYAPSAIIWTSSAVAILTSHKILRQRNVALAMAYATLDKSFKEYRQRVADRYGDDKEKEIRYNIKALEQDETIINDKGKEKVVKKSVDVSDLGNYSMYARYFGPENVNWDNNELFRDNFLAMEQRHANNMLIRDGRLFLSDVLKRLGFKPDKASQVVGWTYDEINPQGDNYIDFGIFKTKRANASGELEVVYILDFNCEGDIWSDM